MKKPLFQNVTPLENSSILLTHNNVEELVYKDYWHFHPEYEIAYIPNGSGKRFIGHRISKFSDGDFVFLGPNIPHNTLFHGFESDNYEEYVIQFKGEFLDEMQNFYPEFYNIHELMKKATSGIYFEGNEKHNLGFMLKKMFKVRGFERLINLFNLLNEMTKTKNAENLHASAYISVSLKDRERLKKVYKIIQDHYMEKLTTREIANKIGMTETSFCRFFVKSTGRSFKQALIEVRISKSCDLLSNTNIQVGRIGLDVGFSNASLFNKFFKKIIGENPLSYRKRFTSQITISPDSKL